MTAVGSRDRVERAILGMILAGRFWSFRAIIVAGEPLCDVGFPFRALVTLIRVI